MLLEAYLTLTMVEQYNVSSDSGDSIKSFGRLN